MRYFWTFLICVALAVTGTLIWLDSIIPPGEGAFGIAKLVPFLFVVGLAISFCVIWFLANLAVFLWHRRRRPDERKDVVVISGCVLVSCIALVGMNYIYQRPAPQTSAPPPAQRQPELKDLKGLIDGFCARENQGENLTPADGIFGTMQQLMSISPPDVVEYTADNLKDTSGFLWVIADSPKCTPRLFERFLAVPSVHRFLASNPSAPPQVLEVLSHSADPEVRKRVAGNGKSPEPTLKQLSTDSDKSVRDSAARNLNRDVR
jgi:hypothetical protein